MNVHAELFAIGEQILREEKTRPITDGSGALVHEQWSNTGDILEPGLAVEGVIDRSVPFVKGKTQYHTINFAVFYGNSTQTRLPIERDPIERLRVTPHDIEMYEQFQHYLRMRERLARPLGLTALPTGAIVAELLVETGRGLQVVALPPRMT